MRVPLALLLAAAAVCGATVPPRLAISIEEAITRPGREGKGALVRPLVVIVSDWQTAAAQVEAYSFAGTVSATVDREKSPAGQWNGVIRYSMVEEPGKQPFVGKVAVRLRIRDAIVEGDYAGAFNGIPLSGRAGAGLSFEHMYAMPHNGLLLWMAHLKRPVNGVVIWGNGAALDDRHFALHEDLRAFAAANDLAVIGTGEMRLSMAGGEGQRLLDGIHALAAQSGHEELDRVPIFFMGHSNGGGMAAAFNQWMPGRVAGFVSSHGSTVARAFPAEGLANPGIFTAGEADAKIHPIAIQNVFEALRAKGARISLAIEQGEDHPPGPGSMPFFLLTLQHVVDERHPPKLVPVDDARAWLADNTSWKSGITRIVPAAGFSGNALSMSWLIDQDAAFVYRGLATYNNPLKLERTGAHGPAYERNEPVELAVTRFGDTAWKSVALYDGAVRVGEIARERPRIVLRNQKPGAHAGVLIGELPAGELRTSLPVEWIVWP